MKKIILFASLCLASMSSFAQLRVDSLGKVGIGGSTSANYTATISPVTANGLLINNSSGAPAMSGIEINTTKHSGCQATGIYIGPGGGVSSLNVYGTRTIVGLSNGYSYGSYGALFNYGNTYYQMGAGIYGASGIDGADFAYPGAYAGYFKGDVRVTGTLYATVSTPTTNSTASNVSPVSVSTMSETQQLRVVDRLQDVQLLQFGENTDARATTLSGGSNKSNLFNLSEGESVTQEMLNEYAKDAPLQKTKVSYGLAADQLKEVYPNLVIEDEYGNVSINYVEMIPLLVQSINELNAKIAELEGGGNGNVELMARDRVNATGIDALDDTEVLSLAQNKPNPFSERTTIEVTIPESTTNAALFIYDMNGKQVKQINITERGKTNVSITSEGLEPGMFLYSLIADGKIVSTKKMILTK